MHDCATVCSHSVDRGFRNEVSITVKCTYLCRGEATFICIIYAISMLCGCKFAARTSVYIIVKLFSSSVLAMSGKGRWVNSTAKAIIYNVSILGQRESDEQEQRSSKVDLLDGKGNLLE